jgi:hypothetical protein
VRNGGVVRIVVGCLLIAAGGYLVLKSPTTDITPRVDCGAPGIAWMFDREAAELRPRIAENCHHRGSGNVTGAVVFLIGPGIGVLLWALHVARRGAPRALRVPPPPTGPSIPVEFASAVALTQAGARLGPPAELADHDGVLVHREGFDVVAAVEDRSSPSFVGMLTPETTGTRLRGFVALPATAANAAGVLFVSAAVCALVALFSWMVTPYGRQPSGFILLSVLAALVGQAAVFARIRTNWVFRRGGARVVSALANALECTPPPVPVPEVAARTRWYARPVFIAYLVIVTVLLVLSILRAPHPSRGFVYFGTIGVCVLVGSRILRPWRIRLDGSVLGIGLRQVDLDQVTEVVASRGSMALADGRSRIVVPSVFGTVTSTADMDEAPFSTWSAPTPEHRRIAVAVDRAVRRCALDPPTATALFRAASRPEVGKRRALIPSFLASSVVLGVASVVIGAAAMRLFTM